MKKKELEIISKLNSINDEQELIKTTDTILSEKKKEIIFHNNSIKEQMLTLEKKEITLQGYERRVHTLKEELLIKESQVIKELSQDEKLRVDLVKLEKAYGSLVDNLNARFEEIKIHSDRLTDMEALLIAKIDKYSKEEKKVKTKKPVLKKVVAKKKVVKKPVKKKATTKKKVTKISKEKKETQTKLKKETKKSSAKAPKKKKSPKKTVSKENK